jgi:UDPglucose--hexose-1-phosphate uridylyltransferase
MSDVHSVRELRHDPIQKRWVIIASERSRRPRDLGWIGKETAEAPTAEPRACPFCAGNEEKTPREIWAGRGPGAAPNGPGWGVRVVPNKFPALTIEGELDREGVGNYDRVNGVGAHEVIIENPVHDKHLPDLSIDEFTAVLAAYRARLVDLRGDQRLRYILIFKNHKEKAGASLAHPHSQLIATPVTPRTVAMELETARQHYNLKERCLFCDILRQEISDRERIVQIDEHYATLAPYASRFPFELMVMPRKHQHDFANLSDEELRQLAFHFRDVLRRMKRGLGDPPYNFVLHTAPNTRGQTRRPTYWNTLEVDWHWHIEILPRLTSVAGFEWGTGYYINPTPPEDAAAYLREVEI